MALVEKGDWILINKDKVNSENIEWSQDWGSSRSANYSSTGFFVDGKDATNILFVETAKLMTFTELAVDVDSSNPLYNHGYKHKIQVTDAFQYGQDNEKTMRFLVYHNKDSKPYQHRFTSTNMFIESAKVLKDLVSIASELPIPYIGKINIWFGRVVDMGSSIFGDPLRDF